MPVQARGREMTGWILYRPVSLAAARRLEPILETAARFVAEAPLAASESSVWNVRDPEAVR